MLWGQRRDLSEKGTCELVRERTDVLEEGKKAAGRNVCKSTEM